MSPFYQDHTLPESFPRTERHSCDPIRGTTPRTKPKEQTLTPCPILLPHQSQPQHVPWTTMVPSLFLYHKMCESVERVKGRERRGGPRKRGRLEV